MMAHEGNLISTPLFVDKVSCRAMIQWPARSSDRPDPVTGHPKMVIILGGKDGTIVGSGSIFSF